MEENSLEDLVYTYPDKDDNNLQKILSEKQEFRELKTSIFLENPQPGEFYPYQLQDQRFMLQYDKLLAILETGTGKTCDAIGIAEQFGNKMIDEITTFVDEYVRPVRTNIKKVVYLTQNELLIKEVKNQIICKCTGRKYFTDDIKNAKTETERNRRINAILKKYYTFSTYRSFYNKRFKEFIQKAKDTSQRNKVYQSMYEFYSDHLFILDEAHFLRNDLITDQESDEENRYQFYYKLLHNIKRSKILMMTATPMFDNVDEFVPLINLLNDEDNQLTTDENYIDWTFEQFEPYFKNKIAYVRSLPIGVKVIYEGEPIVHTTEEGKELYIHILGTEEIITKMNVSLSTMSEFQTEAYIRSVKTQKAIRLSEIEASTFVYPDGTYGAEGFNNYLKEQKEDDYIVRPEKMKEFRLIMDDIGKYSSKFLEIINRLVNEVPIFPEGTPNNIYKVPKSFLFWDYVQAGLAPFSVILKLLKFDEFPNWKYKQYFGEPYTKESTTTEFCKSEVRKERTFLIKKEPRFALLTGSTREQTQQKILELFNSYENRYGEYLQVLIGSKETRLGLNLSNTKDVEIFGPSWNYSNVYQALSRAIRADSHIDLLLELRERLGITGPNERNPLYKNIDPKIDVRVYRNGSIPNPKLENELIELDEIRGSDNKISYVDGTDVQLYITSEEKDIKIKKILRMMKRYAFDCNLNKDRNVRVGDNIPEADRDKDGSPECDYMECDYECYDNPSDKIIMDSYNVLYTGKLVSKLKLDIINILSRISKISWDELRNVITKKVKEPKLFINGNLNEVVLKRAVDNLIKDKQIINNRFGIPGFIESKDDYIYIQPNIPVKISDTDSKLAYYSDKLIAVKNLTLAEYNNTYKVNLIDIKSIIEEYPLTSEDEKIKFRNFLKGLDSNNRIYLLEESIIKTINKDTKQGKIEYNEIYSEIINFFYHFIFEFNKPTINISLQENVIKSAGTGRGKKPGAKTKSSGAYVQEIIPTGVEHYVYLHTLYGFSSDFTSYNTSTVIKKAPSRIRIYDVNENVGFRDLSKAEYQIYSQLIDEELASRFSAYNINPLYGIYIRIKNIFLIVKKPEAKKTLSGTSIDTRTINRGRECKTWDLISLQKIAQELNLEISNDKDELCNKILEKFSEDDLLYVI